MRVSRSVAWDFGAQAVLVVMFAIGGHLSAQQVCYKLRDQSDPRVRAQDKQIQGELTSAVKEKESGRLIISIKQNASKSIAKIDNFRYELCQTPFSLCAEGEAPIEGDIIAKSGNTITISTAANERDYDLADWKVCQPRDCAANPTKAGCDSPQPVLPAATEVVIAGSSTVGLGPLPVLIEAYAQARGAAKPEAVDLPEKAKVYALKRPEDKAAFLRITVKSVGSEKSIDALAAKTADIGMSSRDLLGIPASDAPDYQTRKQEADKNLTLLKKMGGKPNREDIETVLALDGVLLIVNPANPVRTLGLCDAAKIFAGEATRWDQVPGGGSGPISVFTRNRDSGTFETFRELVLRSCGKAEFSTSAKERASAAEVFRDIQADRNAIGFTGISLVPSSVKTLTFSGECGIESKGSKYEIKTEDYPLSRRLFLYTPYTLSKNAQDFLTFIKTNDAAETALSRSETAVGQTIEDPQGYDLEKIRERMNQAVTGTADDRTDAKDLQAKTAGLTRLSLTYRFETSGVILDAKGLQDIKRLVNYLYREPVRGKVLVAGFADSRGSYRDEVKALSVKRAAAVKSALVRAGINVDPANLIDAGFGRIAPVACNSNNYLELSRNRRVEVWVQPK